MTSLRSLNFFGNAGIDDKGGEQICIALTISQYCKLQSLDLGRTEIGMNSIRALGEYLISPSSSRLKTLDLSWNKKIGKNEEIHTLCSGLSLNSTLLSLNLKCGVGDQGTSALQNLLSNYNSSLSTINLNDNDIDSQLKQQVEKLSKSKDRYDNSKISTANRKSREETEAVSIPEDNNDNDNQPLGNSQLLLPMFGNNHP